MDRSVKVKELIAKQLNKPVESVTEDKEILKDLGADSLDIVELLMAFEEEFGVSIPEEDAMNIKTVADVITLVNKQ